MRSEGGIVDSPRYLVVIADDYGIGPATSSGILDLAGRGRITGAVLLVNSPFAEASVCAWRESGVPLEIGWHPCLTLDRPVLPAEQVPSLVGSDGCFRPLGAFVRRLACGRARRSEVAAELNAQYRRFIELIGRRPLFVNAHHHVQVFWPVGAILRELLCRQEPLPYIRRIREPWTMLPAIPGARAKRVLLSTLGRLDARMQDEADFPGNDWLAGITDPPCVRDPDYMARWLTRIPGRVVELACHPGHWDPTLVGRDCTWTDGMLQRRTRERELLDQPGFEEACRRAGFVRVPPSFLLRTGRKEPCYAA